MESIRVEALEADNSSEKREEILDERYQVVEEAIHGAFCLLLSEKEMHKISVSDVIKKAGIVRSTFYNHYENIPALVNAIEDQTIRDIFRIMEGFRPKNDKELCRSYFRTICEYARSNVFLGEILKSPRGDAFLEKALSMFHEYVHQILQNTKLERDKEAFSYFIASTIGSTLGVLHKWSKDGFVAPIELVVNLLTKQFLAGMYMVS